MPNMTDLSEKHIKQHMELLCKIRRKAALKAHQVDEQMVQRQMAKEPPSIYKVGESVLVQFDSKKWNKVKGKGVAVNPSCPGKVLACNLELNKYKIETHVDGKEVEEWMNVSKISSLTRAQEKMREKNEQGIYINRKYALILMYIHNSCTYTVIMYMFKHFVLYIIIYILICILVCIIYIHEFLRAAGFSKTYALTSCML